MVQLPFCAVKPESDEVLDLSLGLPAAIEEIARQKAKEVFLKHKEALVLAADTVVVLNGEILGKPRDEAEALRMLMKISGKTHQVITSVCLMDDRKTEVFSSITEVVMRAYGEAEASAYVQTKEVLDKAGAYAIQGLGALLVEKINGDYYTVMGLPLAETVARIKAREEVET
jgi:septum formation protein